jgi:hypothetical protein
MMIQKTQDQGPRKSLLTPLRPFSRESRLKLRRKSLKIIKMK